MKEIEIRILKDGEIDEALDLFCRMISRQWPNTQEETRKTVEEDFRYKNTIVVGAHDGNKLVGTIYFLPAKDYFDYFDDDEHVEVRDMLKTKLEENYVGDLNNVVFVGGLSVEEGYEGHGIATRLHTFAEDEAKSAGFEYAVAHTAKPTEKYFKLKSLPILLNNIGMQKLFDIRTFYYKIPPDMEKVWLYKKL